MSAFPRTTGCSTWLPARVPTSVTSRHQLALALPNSEIDRWTHKSTTATAVGCSMHSDDQAAATAGYVSVEDNRATKETTIIHVGCHTTTCVLPRLFLTDVRPAPCLVHHFVGNSSLAHI